MNQALKRVTKVVLATVIGASLSSCAVNPVTNSPDVVLMTETEEIRKGRELHEKMMKTTPIYTDEKVNAYINELGQKIAAKSERPDLKYTFTIIDAADINAYALPGGYVYLNRGLLTYLTSEAQLAGVIAHEIAHITARHAVRQDATRTGAKALSILTILATGNASLAETASLMGSVAVKGYGREMELEADSIAAQYLYDNGYDPQAMVEAIGILKDQERFSRQMAKDAGRKSGSYHGVFSTHPRNDQRLKSVIAKAGTLPDDHVSDVDPQRFRDVMEGLVIGNNYDILKRQKKKEEPNRYTHPRMGFTVLFPETWEIDRSRQAIVGSATDKSASMTLTVDKNKEHLPPSEFLRQNMGIPLLTRSEDFKQNGLRGHTGIVPATANSEPKRVAVFFRGTTVYTMTGEVTDPKPGVNYDEMFMNTIKSFSPARRQQMVPKNKTIHYVRATDKTTFALLAQANKSLGQYGEEQLRLINGYYPRGEPKAGEWIKIIK